MDIAGGVISGLGLLGVQVLGDIGGYGRHGLRCWHQGVFYQAQRLVEDCWRFQSEECDCGNEQLDPGETCDYAIADSCYFGDHDLCEPVEGQCMAPRVIGDPRACNEECIQNPSITAKMTTAAVPRAACRTRRRDLFVERQRL